MPRILIVNPDDQEAEQLKRHIALTDSEFHVAETTTEASRIVEQTRIEVGFVDSAVIEREGILALLNLRDLNPDLQMVALLPRNTSAALLDDIQRARFDYIWKPAHPADLVHKIKQALDRIWLERHSRQLATALDLRIQDLRSLHEMAQKISSSLDYRWVAAAVTDAVREVLRTEGASLMMWDPEQQNIRIDVATGPGGRIVEGMTLDRGEGIVGWVIEHDEPTVVQDVRNDPRFSPRFDKLTGLTTRSIACAPLHSQGKVIGAVEAVNRQDDLPFGEEDLELLVEVASHASLALENARLCRSLAEERENLSRHNHEIRDLYVLNRELNTLVDYQELVKYLVQKAPSALGGCKAAALLVQEEDGFFLYLPSSKLMSSGCERRLTDHSLSEWNRLSPFLLTEGEITVRHFEEDGQSLPPAGEELRVVASIPLVTKKRMVGLLMLADTEENELDMPATKLLTVAGNHAAISVENALLYEQTARLSKMDGLTGVYNRRAFDEQLTIYFERGRRFKEHLSLMIVDADHFKKVNDNYGHQAGDRVLKQLALILTGEVRSIDPVFRYGGEEFAVLLPNADRNGAEVVAERVRQQVETVRFAGELSLPLTISIGVATYPDPRITKPGDIVALADEALYDAKAGGRNQVRTK